MSTTLMSLEILRFLLPHMDANRRFEISRRCPALRDFEKSVPLKINSLMFDNGCVMVNDTSYTLSIIRKHNAGEVPPLEFENKIGVQYEVDKYGFEDFSDETRLTPGDVEINRPWIVERMEMMNNDEFRILLENLIQNNEADLANRLERRPNRDPSAVDKMRKSIAMCRAKLLDYQYRRENNPPNYEHFLQLTTTRTVDEQQQKTIQRYNHNKKYSDAVKHMTTVLLGGRSSPICVEKMQILYARGVIRLPVGLKFKIDQLKCRVALGSTLEAVAPILHESSFPLKKLVLNDCSAEDVHNPIVTTARCLELRMIPTTIPQTISTLTNPVVLFDLPIVEQDVVEVVEQWLESQRPVGFEYIIHDSFEPLCANEMGDILMRINGKPADEGNVIFPMSNATQLKVSYGSFPEFVPCSRWAVRFLTEAIEY
ncbi:unnamed protein product [Caenorhabditis brenneri]